MTSSISTQTPHWSISFEGMHFPRSHVPFVAIDYLAEAGISDTEAYHVLNKLIEIENDKLPLKENQGGILTPHILSRFKLSKELLRCIRDALLGKSFIINAVAGSGKSASLRLLGHFKMLSAGTKDRFLYIMFNRSVREDMERQINNQNVTVRTLNAITFGLVHIGKFGNAQIIDNDKIIIISKSLTGDSDYSTQIAKGWEILVADLMDLQDTEGCLRNLTDREFKLPLPHTLNDEFIDLIRKVDQLARDSLRVWATNTELDRYALENKLCAKSYASVFIDEFQDLSRLQINLIKILFPETHCVFVGDPHQSIYGFRGSCVDALAYIKSQFSITIENALPLSHRTPIKVTALANQLNPLIRHRHDAKEGKVIHLSNKLELGNLLPQLPNGTMFIALTNNSLLDFLLHHIHYGKSISAIMATSQEIESTRSLIQNNIRMRSSLSSLVAKETHSEELVTKPINVDSLAETCMLAAKLNNGTTETAYRYAMLLRPSGEQADFQISTIHRAKGLEAEYVVFLDYFPMDALSQDQASPSAREKLNALYVGITRSSDTLITVPNQ